MPYVSAKYVVDHESDTVASGVYPIAGIPKSKGGAVWFVRDTGDGYWATVIADIVNDSFDTWERGFRSLPAAKKAARRAGKVSASRLSSLYRRYGVYVKTW